jgi:hypothetical protein
VFKTLYEIGSRRAAAVVLFGVCSWGFFRFTTDPLDRWRVESIPMPLATVTLLSVLGALCGALVAFVAFADRPRAIWGAFHGTVASLSGAALYLVFQYFLFTSRLNLGWSTITSAAHEAPKGNLYTGWYAVAGAAMGLVYGFLQAQLRNRDKRVHVTMSLLYGLAGALAWVIVPAGHWVS